MAFVPEPTGANLSRRLFGVAGAGWVLDGVLGVRLAQAEGAVGHREDAKRISPEARKTHGGDDGMTERTADIVAIGQVMATYCRGVDRLDTGLLEKVFWPESYDDHGTFEGGRSEFLEWVVPSMRHYSATNFMIGQSHCEFRGNRAAVETLFSARGWGLGGNPEQFSMLCGRYADLFEKRGGEWRILHRTVIYDGAMTGTAMPLAFPHQSGSRDREDQSYHIFEKGPVTGQRSVE